MPVNSGSRRHLSAIRRSAKWRCGEANHAEHAVTRQIIQELPVLAGAIWVNQVRFIDDNAANVAQ